MKKTNILNRPYLSALLFFRLPYYLQQVVRHDGAPENVRYQLRFSKTLHRFVTVVHKSTKFNEEALCVTTARTTLSTELVNELDALNWKLLQIEEKTCLFVTPRTRELDQSIGDLPDAIVQRSFIVIEALTDSIAKNHLADIELAVNQLSIIEVLCGVAVIARMNAWVKPTFLSPTHLVDDKKTNGTIMPTTIHKITEPNQPVLHIVGGRHVLMDFQTNRVYVRNDTTLGSIRNMSPEQEKEGKGSVKVDQRIELLTGPICVSFDQGK